jgi:hypothetical protein
MSPLHQLEIPEHIHALPISELAGLLAQAMHPAPDDDEDELMRQSLAQLQWDDDIKQAVKSGLLQPRNPITAMPVTMATPGSVVSVQDVQEYLETMGSAIRVTRGAAQPQAAATALATHERQARRWQLCVDAGLPMPQDTYAQLPRGIGRIAEAQRITRQALAQDLNAYRERIFGG